MLIFTFKLSNTDGYNLLLKITFKSSLQLGKIQSDNNTVYPVTFTNAIIFINSPYISYDKFVYSQFSNGVIIFKLMFNIIY